MIEKPNPPLRGGRTEELRKDIDRGRTGDKVPFPDPAAAPLGADDEAAGRPASPEAVEMARRSETAGDSRRAPGVTEQNRSRFNAQTATPWKGIGIGIAILVLAGILFALFAGP